MAVAHSNPTVTATAAALNGPESDFTGGASIAVKVPVGGSTVYVGGPGVTAATGYPVTAGEAVYLDLDPAERLYAVTAASQVVNVLARGV